MHFKSLSALCDLYLRSCNKIHVVSLKKIMKTIAEILHYLHEASKDAVYVSKSCISVSKSWFICLPVENGIELKLVWIWLYTTHTSVSIPRFFKTYLLSAHTLMLMVQNIYRLWIQIIEQINVGQEAIRANDRNRFRHRSKTNFLKFVVKCRQLNLLEYVGYFRPLTFFLSKTTEGMIIFRYLLQWKFGYPFA